MRIIVSVHGHLSEGPVVRSISCPKVLLHQFPQFSGKGMEGERGNCELNGRCKAEGNGCWVSVFRKWEMRCQSYGG
jgi:hypothetical protein